MNLEEILIKHYNGHRVWNFSHSKFASLGGSRKGFCAALCACWIRYHSHNDSLANYIGSEQKNYLKGQLAEYMARLNDFFNTYLNIQGYGFYEPSLTLFLKMHGLMPLYSSHDRTVLSFPEEEVLDKLHCRKKKERPVSEGMTRKLRLGSPCH